MPEKMPADLDSPWKDALERFFEPAMLLYFAKAHGQIDWAKGVRFLDKELQRIRPRRVAGRRAVDKLAQVYLKSGAERWILVQQDPGSDWRRSWRWYGGCGGWVQAVTISRSYSG